MYEAPEVLTIGKADELILGVKPFALDFVDNESEIDRLQRVDDVDESDD
jgi:hypothetical protein